MRSRWPVVGLFRAGVRRWRTSSVHGAGVHRSDDLFGVDALQVDAGGAEIHVAELALDDVERHALAREFDGVRVAKLVRSEAPPDARSRSRAAGRPCHCAPAASRAAGRGRVRRARAPPGRADRRAMARRSGHAAASHGGRPRPRASRRRSPQRAAGRRDTTGPCCAARARRIAGHRRGRASPASGIAHSWDGHGIRLPIAQRTEPAA